MKKQVLLLLCILSAGISLAQVKDEYGALTGTVKSAAGNKLQGVSIAVLRPKDSAVVKLAVSSAEGSFMVNDLLPGTYIVSGTAVGHSPYYSAPVTVNAGKPTLLQGGLVMAVLPVDIREVNVRAKKKMIEQRLDRMIVNVDAFITTAGNNAWEVIEKLPGVFIDRDGRINLRGKQGVMVLLDGKQTYLSESDLAGLLKGMSASQLNQVEIMTNPPSRYDAAGNAGVINIKTKKNEGYGLNGSVTASYGQGRYTRANGSLNLNYKTRQSNLNLNYGTGTYNNFTRIEFDRVMYDENGLETSRYYQRSFTPDKFRPHNLKLAWDYYLSEKLTVGVVAFGYITRNREKNNSSGYIKDEISKTDSAVIVDVEQEKRWKNGNLNLNMRRELDSTGELTMDLDYVHYDNDTEQDYRTLLSGHNALPGSTEYLVGNMPLSLNIYSGKIDFRKTLKKAYKMEAGWKSSWVEAENSSNFTSLEDGEWKTEYLISNSFEYKENINAVYLSMSREFKKWSIQAGLRYENTSYKAKRLANPQKPDSAFSYNYDNLFPTLYVEYKLSEDHKLNVSFGRRINRPAYQNLSPFIYLMNRYTYGEGNPYLRPQYTNNIELTHGFKDLLTTTLSYGITKNAFYQIYRIEDDITVYKPSNVDQQRVLTLSTSTQFNVFSWWSASLNGNLYYRDIKGEVNNEQLDRNAFGGFISSNNQFSFIKGWAAELSGFYVAREVGAQVSTNGFWQISCGVSKQLFGDKANVKLSFRDIFYTDVLKGLTTFQHVRERFTQRYDSRMMNIAFTYRFGKNLKPPKNTHREGSTDDERNRVN